MNIVECVPNFSEGRDHKIIKKITDAIASVNGVTLLDVDPGQDTNRTVVTIVGEPNAVIAGAFLGIQKASQVIDLRQHKGTHARMGATDVCPFVPISGVTMNDCVNFSKILAERVGKELSIPVFLYEYSAANEIRRNLANIRAGEFEGMAEKLKDTNWQPDFGPTKCHKTAGVTAIGAREFLIAYNINLNSEDKKLAADIALDIREQGRNKRDENGKFVRDNSGTPIKVTGTLKECKAVGWYIKEYGVAQISMNLTNFNITAPHIAFEESRAQARKRGARVTGSELVGLIPLNAMLNAGRYYLKKQKKSTGIPDKSIIHVAVKSMGLDDLTPFNPKEKIIEYRIKEEYGLLVNMKLGKFADELSSDSPAPGGGSVAAVVGSLAASLTSMVANLTFGKKKWLPLYSQMCSLAEKSQNLKKELLQIVDTDTDAFNQIINAIRLPKTTDMQIKARDAAILEATKLATIVPFTALGYCRDVLDLVIEAAEYANTNSISDAGVAGEIAHAGAHSAALNVFINLKDIQDTEFRTKLRNDSKHLLTEVDKKLLKIRKIVYKIIAEDA